MTNSLARVDGRVYLLEEMIFAKLEAWKIDGMIF